MQKFPQVKINCTQNGENGFYVGFLDNHSVFLDEKGHMADLLNEESLADTGKFFFDVVTNDQGDWAVETEFDNVSALLDICANILSIDAGVPLKEYQKAKRDLIYVFQKASDTNNRGIQGISAKIFAKLPIHEKSGTVLSALRKQISMDVIRTDRINHFLCPICESKINDGVPAYCKDCGQRLRLNPNDKGLK